MARLLCVLLAIVSCVAGYTYNCPVSVVGAGWGGAYFTYRTTLSSDAIYDVDDICIFEQSTTRIGGRAYDYTNPQFWEDLQVDLGAYRFENIQQLVPGVIRNILNLSTICYNGDCDPVQGTTIINDKYGNNGGYAHGVRGLIELFVRAGGTPVYMGHRLTNILSSGQNGAPIQLVFANGVTVNSAKVIIDMPASAVAQLNSTNNLLQTASTPFSSAALAAPLDIQSVKQFVWYPDAWWLTKLNLTVGEADLFDGLFPPIEQMRFGDGAIKCYTTLPNGTRQYASTRVPGGAAKCYGAIMSNYAEFDSSAFNYYLQNVATPQELASGQTAIFITNHDSRAWLLNATHQRIILALQPNLAAAGIDPSTLPLPTSTVIGIWNHLYNPIYPSWYNYMNDSMTAKFTTDTQYALRNLAVKPLPHYDLYVTNEAWSLRGGWAEGALILVERVLGQYFQGFQKPAYVTDLYWKEYVTPYLSLPNTNQCDENSDCSTPNNCVVGTCHDSTCVYNTRTSQSCNQDNNCELNTVCSYSGQCYGPAVVCSNTTVCAGGSCVNPNGPSLPSCSWSNADITFYWQFIGAHSINIAFTLGGVGYTALGIGSSMTNADIWVGSIFNDGTFQVADYYSVVEGPPYLDTDGGGHNDVKNIFIAASSNFGGPQTVFFTRLLNTGDHRDNVIVNGTMNFIYAFPSEDYFPGSIVYHGPNRNTFTVDLSDASHCT